MNVKLCTHPELCEGMEVTHIGMAEELSTAWGLVQQLQAQLMQRDETLAALVADNNRLRMDVQDYMRMFEDATRKAVRA